MTVYLVFGECIYMGVHSGGEEAVTLCCFVGPRSTGYGRTMGATRDYSKNSDTSSLQSFSETSS